jgi:hypothetical protein
VLLVRLLVSVWVFGEGGCRGAHADVCDLLVGSSGVVRAAVEAKGRVPS